MTIQLYVTDWAPNGTNDLLVVRDGEVIDCLPEATFGLDVARLPNQALVLDGTDWLLPVDCMLAEEAEDRACLVAEVSVAQVQQALAVRPGLDRREAQAKLAKALLRAA